MRNATKIRKAYKRFIKQIKPYWVVYSTNKSPRVVDVKVMSSQRA
jgi:hypothetical protein